MNLKPTEVIRINLEDIEPNPFQPRQSFDEEKINELAQNIKEQGGLIQPIKVVAKMTEDFQPITNKYYLIAGERRLRAVKKLYQDTQEMEWFTIEAIPQNISKLTPENYNQILMFQGLTENLARQDLSPVEKAEAIEKIKKETGMTYAVIGQQLGLKESTIKSLISVVNHLTDEEREKAKQEKMGYDKIKKIAREKKQVKTLETSNLSKSDEEEPEYIGDMQNQTTTHKEEKKEEVVTFEISELPLEEKLTRLHQYLSNLVGTEEPSDIAEFLTSYYSKYINQS